ncbi:hypothetical protein OH76DRAFT_1395913 [Lentinus brumalis]|uniref:Uncharacterized protein n=1 Tax=Lentinus brumalis TaxID=2498619 RepID=A0A371DW56_9APHY|nr:hypothetical protein OH76DRAFT_1395913 [Polyporus brumalis]
MAPILARTSQPDLPTFNYIPIIVGVVGGVMGLILIMSIVIIIRRRRGGYFVPAYSYVPQSSSDSGDHHQQHASTSHEMHTQHHRDAHDAAVQSGMMISHSKTPDISTSVSSPPPYSGLP